MDVSVSSQLILLLGAVSLLSGILGACLYRLRAIHLLRSQITEHRHMVKRQDAALQAMSAEHDVTMKSLLDEREAMADAIEEASKSAAQNEALQLHARLQAQRIATFEAERVAVEQQQKSQPRQDRSQARMQSRLHSRSATGTGAPPYDDKFPVLNKRVSGPATRVSQRKRALNITPDHDIPMLSESELPELASDLELADLDDGVSSRG